jgi:hypothetical protein
VYDIVAVPPDTAVTVPPVEIDATPVALLLHVPPVVALKSVAVSPAHKTLVPDIF